MVESSPHKYNFLKLNKDELVNKLAHALSHSIPVVFWKNYPRCYEGKITSNNYHNQKLNVVIRFEFLPVSLKSTEICLNFSIKEVEYFIKAKVLLQSDSENTLDLEISEPAYRVEKRLQERIMTYPQYQCFLYVTHFVDQSNQNVIQFAKKESKEDKIFKLITTQNDVSLDSDGGEIFGLRIEDLNADGLSGVCSLREFEEILYQFKERTINATLMFEQESFNLQDLKMVYNIDYISPLFNSLKMKKVGFSFKHSARLKRTLEDITGVSLEMDDYRSEFEEFIKNE